jgi:hypothetical protein
VNDGFRPYLLQLLAWVEKPPARDDRTSARDQAGHDDTIPILFDFWIQPARMGVNLAEWEDPWLG